MISSERLEKARESARTRVENARLTVDVEMYGKQSEPMQLATFQRVKQNPDLEGRLRKKYGEQGWQKYETAMGELKAKLGG